MFAYWCEFYYQIYKLDERPPNEIIEDDFELDAWVRSKRIEYEHAMKKAKQQALEGGRGGVIRKVSHEKFI
jgi:hypothetical protein